MNLCVSSLREVSLTREDERHLWKRNSNFVRPLKLHNVPASTWISGLSQGQVREDSRHSPKRRQLQRMDWKDIQFHICDSIILYFSENN